ncbi:MAG: hypothetical protein GKR89_27580 [Candidatus Latescibacteria bacterium]|nr:hypothetical protein [Candidatus Latescibacterota bacterium]
MTSKDEQTDVDVLKALLRDADGQVQLNAAVRLAYEGCDAGLDLLIGGLSHPTSTVRFSQVPDALKSLGKPARQKLQQSVFNPAARTAAARALFLLGDTRDIGRVLAAALAGDDPEEQQLAVRLSGEVGAAAVTALPDLQRLALEGMPLACAALAVVGGGAGLPQLLQGVDHVDGEVRYRAMRGLAGLGPGAAAAGPSLRRRLMDEDLPLSERLTAAQALRCVSASGGEVVDDIGAALTSGDRWLRIGLLRELAKMGPKYAAKKAANTDEWPRWEARWAHRQGGDLGADFESRVLPVFVAALDDPDHDIKRNAMLGLALAGPLPPAAAKAIEQASGLCQRLRADVLRRGGVQAASRVKCSCDLVGLHEPDIDLDLFSERCEKAWATGGRELDDTLPKWIFLKYLVERHGFILHGTRTSGIDTLQPLNKSGGGNRTSDQPGIFAVDHASMAMYFGVVDRTSPQIRSLSNSLDDGRDTAQVSRRYCRLGVTMAGLSQRPFVAATVYVLPRQTFSLMGEWTSLTPVKPVAEIPVSPTDFPFLDFLWGSDLGPLSTQFGARSQHLYDVSLWASKRSAAAAHIQATPTPWEQL